MPESTDPTDGFKPATEHEPIEHWRPLPGATGLERVFFGVSCLFFLWTVLFQLGRWLGFSFETICNSWGGCALAIGFGVGGRWFVRRSLTPEKELPPRADLKRAFFGLFALGSSCFFLEVLFSTWRSDVFVYFSGPAHAVRFPEEALDFRVYGLADAEGVAHYYFLPYTYEYWLACLSRLTGIPLPAFGLQWVPAMVAFSMPFAWYVLLSHFSNRVYSALGAALGMLAFLLVSGESDRSFGSFGILRLADNKGILINLLFPLVVARVLSLEKKHGWRETRGDWIALFFLLSCGAGLTLNALFLLPCLTLLVVLASTGERFVQLRSFSVRLPFQVAIAHAYLLLVVGLYFLNRHPGFRSWQPATNQWGFSKHVASVFGDFPSVQLFLVLGGVAGCSFFWRRRGFGFVVFWAAFLVFFFFNPISYNRLQGLGWGEISSYWRFVFLAPVPLAMGLVVSVIFDRFAGSAGRFFLATAAVLGFVVGFTIFFPDRSSYGGLVDEGGGIFGPRDNPGLNARRVRWSPFSVWAKVNGMKGDLDRLHDADLPSPMLSSRPFSEVLPLFRPDVTQVSVKANMMRHVGAYLGDRDFARQRFWASEYLFAKSSSASSFLEVVRTAKPRTLLMVNRVAELEKVVEFLTGEGFSRVLELPDTNHTVWVR